MPVKDVHQTGKIAQWITLSTLMRAAVMFSMLFTVVLLKLPFYGDQATLVSGPAQYYYDSGFSSLILPAGLETGHPPLYPILIAVIWTVFGKSLAAVHIVSFLCVLFLIVQVYRLIQYHLPTVGGGIAMLFVWCFPVLWAQVAGMGCDVLLTALVLFIVNQHQKGLTWRLAFALAVLPLLSMRGWIWLGATGLYALWTSGNVKARIRVAGIWCLSIIPVVLYYILHAQVTGWWLLPEHNNWANHRSFNSPVLAAGKAFEWSFRLLEFGMIIPVFVWLWSCIQRFRLRTISTLDIFILCALFALAAFTLPFRGPIVVRYMLPVHIAILIASAATFGKRLHIAGNKALLLPICICLWMVSCHFYAYPQMRRSLFEYSWGDGSLAHLSYFTHRSEMRQYIDQHAISRSKIYTAFPETKSYAETELQDDTTHCITLTADNIDQAEWVIYSNVMNMIDFELAETLQAQFAVEKRWEAYPVFTILYHRKQMPIAP